MNFQSAYLGVDGSRWGPGLQKKIRPWHETLAQECQVTLFQGSLEIIWLTDEKRKTFALF